MLNRSFSNTFSVWHPEHLLCTQPQVTVTNVVIKFFESVGLSSLWHQVVTKIPIWGWQTPQLHRPEKASNQNHEKGKIVVIIKPWTCVEWAKFRFWQVCWFNGLMSGRYAWYQVIVMDTAPCTRNCDGDCLYQFLYQECQKSPAHLIVHYAHIWWGRNFIIEPRSLGNECPCLV